MMTVVRTKADRTERLTERLSRLRDTHAKMKEANEVIRMPLKTRFKKRELAKLGIGDMLGDTLIRDGGFHLNDLKNVRAQIKRTQDALDKLQKS